MSTGELQRQSFIKNIYRSHLVLALDAFHLRRFSLQSCQPCWQTLEIIYPTCQYWGYSLPVLSNGLEGMMLCFTHTVWKKGIGTLDLIGSDGDLLIVLFTKYKKLDLHLSISVLPKSQKKQLNVFVAGVLRESVDYGAGRSLKRRCEDAKNIGQKSKIGMKGS